MTHIGAVGGYVLMTGTVTVQITTNIGNATSKISIIVTLQYIFKTVTKIAVHED